MRASASMPMASQPVEMDGRKYLDGGIADSIPLQYMEQMGFPHSIVILTQPQGFVKQPNRLLPLLRVVLRRYPNTVRALETRHERYNRTLAEICRKEKAGQILVIRPDAALKIGAREKNEQELERVYQLGRETGQRRIDEIRAFIAQ